MIKYGLFESIMLILPQFKLWIMQAIEEINQKILLKTLDIQTNYPELSKYLEEMPITIPDLENPQITLQNLKEYYNSLNVLVNDYASTHIAKKLWTTLNI